MDKTERQEYMADYNKMYYQVRRGRETVSEIMNNFVLVVQPTSLNFKGNDQDEPIVCSEFGCPNHLTAEQQLYGSKCPHHQHKKKIEPSDYISYPHKKSA